MFKNSLTLIFMLIYIGCGSSSSSDGSTSTGKAGSQSLYQIVGDNLYTVSKGEMTIFDISTPSKPTKLTKIRLPWDVETLYAYKDNLYIGAESGVYIYDNSDPLNPTRISKFVHVQSCDPVVISDDIAYVTLHSLGTCWQEGTNRVNRLEILDVANPNSPKLIKTVDMWSPRGLGVDKEKLFICDGDNGLKVFNVTKTENNGTVDVEVKTKESLSEINCYDVIAYKDTLIVSNHEDIRQFDYSSFPMVELGKIK